MTVNDSEEFFDCVRNWSYGKKRKINGYYCHLNVKITEHQQERMEKLLTQKSNSYVSISDLVRKAIENLLTEEQR